mmetsp:Transcript_35258/g.99805  ORF Transcript_35258/g.99805 Transcript_35258/m.99805 type:complete len:283 (-) Transcript_35258:557-1405(-)
MLSTLHLRDGFPSKGGLVDNSAAAKHEGVAWDNVGLALDVAEGDEVSWEQVVRGGLLPLLVAVNHQGGRLVPHAPDGFQVPQTSECSRSLKHENHDQSERSVLPVLVKHPQQHAEDLEDSYGTHQLGLEQLGKRWAWYLKRVHAKLVLCCGGLCSGQPLCLLDVGTEGEVVWTVQVLDADVLALKDCTIHRLARDPADVFVVLEDKGECAGHTRARDLHNVISALVLQWSDVCKGSRERSGNGAELHEDLPTDRPVRHEHEEDVHCSCDCQKEARPEAREEL